MYNNSGDMKRNHKQSNTAEITEDRNRYRLLLCFCSGGRQTKKKNEIPRSIWLLILAIFFRLMKSELLHLTANYCIKQKLSVTIGHVYATIASQVLESYNNYKAVFRK